MARNKGPTFNGRTKAALLRDELGNVFLCVPCGETATLFSRNRSLVMTPSLRKTLS